VAIFCPGPDFIDFLKGMQPAELIELGEPFTKESYEGVYIPYAVRYKWKNKVKKLNIAMQNKNIYGRWVVDGGI
jgi:hypothetical protein